MIAIAATAILTYSCKKTMVPEEMNAAMLMAIKIFFLLILNHSEVVNQQMRHMNIVINLIYRVTMIIIAIPMPRE